jgi:hypothetical protein
MSNGVRINWNNIGYLDMVDNSADDGYTFIVRWKYKASIRREEIKLKKPNVTLFNYFKQYNLIELFNGTFVNLSRIMLIEEKAVHGPQEMTLVRMVFLDGFELIKKIPADKWQSWKSLHA